MIRKENELDYMLEIAEFCSKQCLQKDNKPEMGTDEIKCAKVCAQKGFLGSRMMMTQMAESVVHLSPQTLMDKMNT